MDHVFTKNCLGFKQSYYSILCWSSIMYNETTNTQFLLKIVLMLCFLYDNFVIIMKIFAALKCLPTSSFIDYPFFLAKRSIGFYTICSASFNKSIRFYHLRRVRSILKGHNIA